MDGLDAALLLLRAWVGLVMFAHGLNHARNQPGTTRWLAKVGFRSAGANARLSAGSEMVVGVALAAGFLTSPAAAGVVATMIVAFWAIHRHAGFFVFHRPDEGYEYVATLTAIAVALAVTGPGQVSIDAALSIDTVFDGWTGLGIVLLGVLVAVAQLALFLRRPPSSDPGS